jgi:MFS family permease
MMVNRGMLSQFIPYFMEKGYTREQSATFMSLFALFALVGTNVWGFIDQKLGTKKATLVYCLCYGITLIVLFLPYTGTVMFIGFALFHFNQGATAKMLPSMAVQCYGRYEFPSVMRLLQPLLTVIFALAPWFVGVATALAGSIAKSPIIFAAAVAVGAIIFAFIKPNPRTDIIYDAPTLNEASNN